MGMFDNIKFEMDCPICKSKMSGFQSKDGACLLNTLSPFAVNNFYSSCPNCSAWIEFNKKEEDISEDVSLNKVLQKFTMSVEELKRNQDKPKGIYKNKKEVRI